MRDVELDANLSRRQRHAPLFALFAANMVSAVGDVLTFLAIPWFVLQTTGSATQTGITAFFATASVAVSAFFGSGLVDRLGYRRASVISDLASGVSVAVIPLLYQIGALAFWELLALVFLAGLFTTPGSTARAAMVPEMAGLARMPLERASAATDGITRISRFIGAPLAGVLIALVGPTSLLWIDAATFTFSAALIALAVPAAAVARQSAPTQAQAGEALSLPQRAARYLSELGQGARFLWRDPVLLSIIATVMLTNLLDAGFGGVLAPLYIRQVFGNAIVLGGIFAVFGLTAFLGTVVFGAIGHRLPRRLTLGGAFTLAGGTRFLALALIPAAPLLLAVQGIAGFFIGPINPLIDTLEYERVPQELRARVFGTTTAGAMIGTPLGALLAGLCATGIGARATLLAFGACYLAATLSLLVNPALKGMERPDVVETPIPVEV